MRVAAIDVGTNSTRLLIAEAHKDGYRELDRRLLFTRLGQQVDARRMLGPEAMKRTLGAIAEFCSVCGEFGVSKIRVAGTSAVRDAANAGEFLDAATKLAGSEAIALTGEQEASLSFEGAMADLKLQGPVLICDIGGGSTELVAGTAERGVVSRVSLDMGSVRLTERYLASDPPATAEVLLLEGSVDAMLEKAAGELGDPTGSQLVGLGGTITTLGALSADMEQYISAEVHGMAVDSAALIATHEQLRKMTIQQREQLSIMPPGRADVIFGGACILNRIMSRWSIQRVIVSEHDILDGLVLQILADAQS